jgi:hypothetical protein
LGECKCQYVYARNSYWSKKEMKRLRAEKQSSARKGRNEGLCSHASGKIKDDEDK